MIDLFILDAMDAFESLVAVLLEHKGYWVRSGFKVELTKAEKRQIECPSSPRPELDILAYRGGDNSLLVVECKSFLDSPGVAAGDIAGPREGRRDRYPLFTNPVRRSVIFNRLETQLIETGLCRSSPKITLCLVAGHVASDQDRILLRDHFQRQEWQFWDEEWLIASLDELAMCEYENEVSTIVAKILLRNGRLSSAMRKPKRL